MQSQSRFGAVLFGSNPYLESGTKKYLVREYRAGVASGYPDSVVCLYGPYAGQGDSG